MRPPPRPLYAVVLAMIVGIGLFLRVLAARGGLWLDEAWSASFARDVRTPLGVFLSIHHDNNHHLNTLWLQLVGFDASPVLQRGLSIVTGTAAILVAAAIARPRGKAVAVVTAALFAASPILVTYGSEARGYAPMVLALLCIILIAGRWLEDRARPAPAAGLAVASVLGVLSQMTMAFGVLAVGGWLVVAAGPRRAAAPVIAMLSATALTIATIVVCLPGAGSFGFGAYAPFGARDLFDGMRDMTAFTLGLPRVDAVLVIPIVLLVVGARPAGVRRTLHALALIGLPAGIALLHIGNAGMARYYLAPAVALLLLLGESVSTTTDRHRVMAGIAVAGVLIGSIVGNLTLIGNRRADPLRAVDMILSGEPAVGLDRDRDRPVIDSAAAVRGRTIAIENCAPWLFIDRDGDAPFPDRPTRCGYPYTPVARGDPTGLSGTHWRLYRRE